MPHLLARLAALAIQVVGWPLLGLLAAARLRTARLPWQIDLLDTWLPYLLTPAPALGLLAARVRSRGLGLLAALGSTWAVICWLSLFGRGRCRDLTAGSRLRVLSTNVLGENPSSAGLAALIAREQPDLVALQEVREAFWAGLLERLADSYPYQAVHPHDRNSGAALLSRWPLDEVECCRLARCGHVFQRASLIVEGRLLRLFNVHLDVPFELFTPENGPLPFGVRRRVNSARDDELDRLLDLVDPLTEPVLVLGDFNSAAGSRPYRVLRRLLRDAFQEAGYGLGHTYPRPVAVHGLRLPFPLLRIDYVFYRGPLAPLAARTVAVEGSDHYGVLGDFALPAG